MTRVSLPDGRSGLVALAVCVTALLGTATAAWLATTGRYDSTTAAQLRGLHRALLVLAVPAVVLVEGALVYLVVRTGGKNGSQQRDRTQQSRIERLEVPWAVGMTLLFALVGVLSYQVMVHPAVFGGSAGGGGSVGDGGTAGGGGPAGHPGDTLSITVTAEQYAWTVSYGDGAVRTRDRLVLPANRTVHIRLTSRDVIHSLSVPELGLKRDAFPGQYTTVRTTPTSPGTYRLYCAEFCGSGHARMTATVEVRRAGAFDEWLRDRRPTDGGGSPSDTRDP